MNSEIFAAFLTNISNFLLKSQKTMSQRRQSSHSLHWTLISSRNHITIIRLDENKIYRVVVLFMEKKRSFSFIHRICTNCSTDAHTHTQSSYLIPLFPQNAHIAYIYYLYATSLKVVEWFSILIPAEFSSSISWLFHFSLLRGLSGWKWKSFRCVNK